MEETILSKKKAREECRTLLSRWIPHSLSYSQADSKYFQSATVYCLRYIQEFTGTLGENKPLPSSCLTTS